MTDAQLIIGTFTASGLLAIAGTAWGEYDAWRNRSERRREHYEAWQIKGGK